MWIVRLALLLIAVMLTASVSAMWTVRVLYSNGVVVPIHLVGKHWVIWMFAGLTSFVWLLVHAMHGKENPKWNVKSNTV